METMKIATTSETQNRAKRASRTYYRLALVMQLTAAIVGNVALKYNDLWGILAVSLFLLSFLFLFAGGKQEKKADELGLQIYRENIKNE